MKTSVYVIARIIPHGGTEPHYRCIGTIADANCDEPSDILDAIHRFLTLVKVSGNAEIIAWEIKRLHGKYGAYGAQDPEIPAIPCEYTTMLLAAAFERIVDLEDVEDVIVNVEVQLDKASSSLICECPVVLGSFSIV